MPKTVSAPSQNLTETATARKSSEQARKKARRKQRRWQIIATLVALVGTTTLMYPTAADWFAQKNQAREITGYVDMANGLTSERAEQLFQEALEYNKRLPEVDMIDPYGVNAEEWRGDSAELERYQNALSLKKGAPIAWLQIKKANVSLPVYHGTSEATLQKGAGHLFGSSLPVGGPSSRSIITGHSGDPNAKLFTNIHKLVIGDTIGMRVLQHNLYYRVIDTKVIVPTDVAGLHIENGKDLLTLITCTPIGVNSHRLVVTAERIYPPEDQGAEEYPMDTEKAPPGFPWWAVIILGATGGMYLIGRPQKPKAKKKGKTESVAELPAQAEG